MQLFIVNESAEGAVGKGPCLRVRHSRRSDGEVLPYDGTSLAERQVSRPRISDRLLPMQPAESAREGAV
jgi:hypothetical protein